MSYTNCTPVFQGNLHRGRFGTSVAFLISVLVAVINQRVERPARLLQQY